MHKVFRYRNRVEIDRVCYLIAIGILAMAILVFHGCAHMKTAEGRYAQALTTFNDLMETYRHHYAMQTEEVQAEWDQEITPIAAKASEALDLWKGTLSDTTKEDAYIALQREFWGLLIKYGMKEEQT